MARRCVVSKSTTLQQAAEAPGVDPDPSARPSTTKRVANKRFTKIFKNNHEIKKFLVRSEGVGASGVPPDQSANE